MTYVLRIRIHIIHKTILKIHISITTITPGPTPNISIDILCKVRKCGKKSAQSIHDKKKRKKKEVKSSQIIYEYFTFSLVTQTTVQNDRFIRSNLEKNKIYRRLD